MVWFPVSEQFFHEMVNVPPYYTLKQSNTVVTSKFLTEVSAKFSIFTFPLLTILLESPVDALERFSPLSEHSLLGHLLLLFISTHCIEQKYR